MLKVIAEFFYCQSTFDRACMDVDGELLSDELCECARGSVHLAGVAAQRIKPAACV
jgi:hypothetical protein